MSERLTDEQVTQIELTPKQWAHSNNPGLIYAVRVLSTNVQLLLADRQALLTENATLRRLLAESTGTHKTEGD